MTITSGYFNSLGGDRKYDSLEVGSIFRGVFTDGVFRGYENAFEVVPDNGMTVKVDTGRAWFHDTYLESDTELFVTLDPAYASQSRIDLIILDFNRELGVRSNDILVLKGTPAAVPLPPPLISDMDHNQYPIVAITVQAGSTEVLLGDIKMRTGTAECPWAELGPEHVISDDLILDGIGESKHRNVLINGDMVFRQRSEILSFNAGVETYDNVHVPIPANDSGYDLGLPDRWRVEHNNLNGDELTFGTEEDVIKDGYRASWLKVNWYQNGGGIFAPNVDGKLFLEQRIESSRLFGTRKGTPSARELTLSFMCFTNATGDFAIELLDDFNNVAHSAIYTIDTADVVTKIEMTIPKDVTNQLNAFNKEGLRVRFWLLAGDNYTSGTLQENWTTAADPNRCVGMTAHLCSVLDNCYYFLTDVQLEFGTITTPFNRISLSETVSLCQEYFEVLGDGYIGVESSNNDGIIPNVRFSVAKRVDPNISILGLSFPYGAPNVTGSFPSNTRYDKRHGTRIWVVSSNFGNGSDARYVDLLISVDSEL